MLKKQKAVTLIEMTVVLLITGIIAAAGFVSAPSTRSMNLDADARKIVSDFWLVREVAATSRTDYCVRFNKNSYTISKNSCDAGMGVFFKQESLSSTIDAPAAPFDLMWYGLNSSPFRLAGMAYSSASSNNQLNMALSVTGRTVTIQVYEQTGYVKKGAIQSCTPVDGQWSNWGACSVTACGQTGIQTHTCTNPPPSCGGADCSGPSTQFCGTSPCPPVCGNSICEKGENQNNCCRDCGCPPGKPACYVDSLFQPNGVCLHNVCGNSICEPPFEKTSNCCTDCGGC